MGFFDELSERFKKWQDGRKEKKEVKKQQQRNSLSQQGQQPQPSQQQLSNSNHNNQVSPAHLNNSQTPSNQQRQLHHSQPDEELFDFDSECNRYPAHSMPVVQHHHLDRTLSPRSQSQSNLQPPHHAGGNNHGQNHQPYLGFRSTSPTSIAGISRTHSHMSPHPSAGFHQHPNFGSLNHGIHLGSSPSFSRSNNNQQFQTNHGGGSAYGTPVRPYNGASGAGGASSENKEEINEDLDLFEEMESIQITNGNNGVRERYSRSQIGIGISAGGNMNSQQQASSSSGSISVAQTSDEQYAELLQQQEYLSFMEENGEISHSDAASLAATAEKLREKEVRRARRKDRKDRESAALAARGIVAPVAMGGSALGLAAGGASAAINFDSPANTPSPAPDEASSAQALASFAAFQLRTARALQEATQPSHSSSRPHALSASASLSSLHHPHPPHHPQLQFQSPSRSSSVSHSTSLQSFPHQQYASPSHSHSHSHSHSSQPPSDTTTLRRSSSLSKHELNSLPTFQYVPSPLARRASAANDALASDTASAVAAASTLTPLPFIDTSSIDSCSICLGDFEEFDKLRCLPCMHKYHAGCVDDWLARSSVCPNCNSDVREAFDR